MIKKIVNNILFSGIEQMVKVISQFLSSFIIVRNLPREDYGILGVVVGYYVFFSVVNVSFESVILRDHAKYKSNISRILLNFVTLNLFKVLLLLVLSVVLSIILYLVGFSVNVFFAVGISFFVLSGQAIVSPFVLYFSSKFNQKLVTKVTVIKTVTRLIGLCGLFYYRDLFYYFSVELIINIFYCCFWFFLAKRKLEFKFSHIFCLKKMNWIFVKDSIVSYSLWTHLTGFVTNFVYRSDTFFLSFFVGLTDIGNYNIALNSSNIANIIPSILGYQNSVALSNVTNDKEIENVTNGFLKMSVLLGILSFLGFTVLGRPFLYIITGDDNITEIYNVLLLIVLSLIIIKTISSPLVALINIKGNVKDFFKNVSVPLLIFVILTYTYSSWMYGVRGVALANVVNSMFWLFLVIKEVNKYKYSNLFKIDMKNDLVELKKVLKTKN